MARDGAIISVSDDVGRLLDVLVQGPVCTLSGAPHPGGGEAVRQHARLVAELERAGVVVRQLDALLSSALGFADARDWIVERRVGEQEDSRRRRAEIMAWMSEQPAATLTGFLMEGMPLSALPPGFGRQDVAPGGTGDWFLPPLADMTQVRSALRFIGTGAVVCPLQAELNRALPITISAVLNFAPLFDGAQFEFWLTPDGAEPSCPPIDGRDLALPGGLICVAAITRATSVQALSALAAALLRKNGDYRIFWLDLTATGCDRLEDCLVPLGRDCLLVDSAVLGSASACAVRASRHGFPLTIEPCQTAFLDEIRRALGMNLCLIDANRHDGPVRAALSRLAPVVLSAGRIIAFEAHRAAFDVLERNGIEIVAALEGSALSPDGRGPRGLVSALRAGQPGEDA